MTGVTTCTPMNGPTLALFLIALLCALALAFYWGAGWHKALMDSDPATLADVATGTRPASVGVDPAPAEQCPQCQGRPVPGLDRDGSIEQCSGCGVTWHRPSGELAPLLIVDNHGDPLADAWSVGEAMEYVVLVTDAHVATRHEWARRADA